MTTANSPTVTCLVRSESPEGLLAAERVASEKASLDTVITDVVHRFPNGVEQQEEVKYRLGDYFDGIQVIHAPANTKSFKIVFQVRQGAGRFWRDLMADVLRSIRSSSANISTSIARPVGPTSS